MLINNLENILPTLVWGEDIFYFIQVLWRRKDNLKDGKKGPQTRQLYTRFVDTEEHLVKAMDDIIEICGSNNARCYMSINPRSRFKFAWECIYKYQDICKRGQFGNSVFDVPQSSALSSDIIWRRDGKKPVWLIDIDRYEDYQAVKEFIIGGCNTNVVLELPSPNGRHLVVNAFDPRIPGLCGFKGSKEEFEMPGGQKFTIREECNIILYSNLK